MIGPLISAGASLLGGLLGKSSADKARQQAEAHSLRQEAMQREFAQNGIQWKVEDAKKAGIHPIYALGGSTASYAPVSQAFTADTSLPNALASAGQDVGRAIHATRTAKDRNGAVDATVHGLQLEGLKLDNDLKRAEIASKAARLRADQVGPPHPTTGDDYNTPGQANSGVKPKPLEVAPGASNRPHQESGSITDIGWARTATGWAMVPSKDVKERIEDVAPYEWSHWLRNPGHAMFQVGTPPFDPPPGKKWFFHPIKQEYQLIDLRSIPRKSGF